MRKKKSYSHYGLLVAAAIHLILYAFLVFISIKVNTYIKESTTIFLIIMVVPIILAIIAFLSNRSVWMYIGFIFTLPGIYIFLTGKGFAKLFIVSPLLFLFTAIMFQVHRNNTSN